MRGLWEVHEWRPNDSQGTQNCSRTEIQGKLQKLLFDGYSESTPFVPMDMRSSPFMSGSWEVYEWLMSKQWVATATQRIILNFFTIFNYQHISHICFRVNTMTLNSYSPVMNSLESRFTSDSGVTHENPQYIRFMSECAECRKSQQA